MVAWISRGALPVVTFICPLKPSLALLTAAEQLLPEPFAREPCRLADKQFLLKASPVNIQLLPKMFGAEPSPFYTQTIRWRGSRGGARRGASGPHDHVQTQMGFGSFLAFLRAGCAGKTRRNLSCFICHCQTRWDTRGRYAKWRKKSARRAIDIYVWRAAHQEGRMGARLPQMFIGRK